MGQHFIGVDGWDGAFGLAGTIQFMTDEQRQIRELRKWLKLLTRSVSAFIKLADDELSKPSDYKRGQRMAGWVNSLEIHNDEARHFGLGENL